MVGSALLAGVLVVGGVACSDDPEPEAGNDRGEISFSEAPPGSTDLGLCQAYLIDDMKGVLGGDEGFRRLAPEAIGTEGDAVTGEVCSWERTEANGDVVALRIEARTFGEDVAALDQQFAALEEGTIEATPVEDVGDDAFSSVSEETSLLQVRSGPFLLTLASRASGDLEPLDLDLLRILGATGLGQIQ